MIVAQNLVAARYVQLTPAYRSSGPTMADGAVIPVERTAVPVEWDEVKDPVDAVGNGFGTQQQGVDPVGGTVHRQRRRRAWAATATSCGRRWPSCPAWARILAKGSGNIVDIIKNLQTFVTALRDSNAQIVQFKNRLATLTSVLNDSRSDLDAALTNLSTRSAKCSDSSPVVATRPPSRLQRLADVTQISGRQPAWRWKTSCTSRRTRSPTATTSTTPTPGPRRGVCGPQLRQPGYSSSARRSGPWRTSPRRRPASCARSIWARRCGCSTVALFNFNYLPIPINPFLAQVGRPGQHRLHRASAGTRRRGPEGRVRPSCRRRCPHIPGCRATIPPTGTATTAARPTRYRDCRRCPNHPRRPSAASRRPPPAPANAAGPALPAEGTQPMTAPGRSLQRALWHRLLASCSRATGCAFHGLNSLPLPGAVGRGSGADIYHVEIANVGTLESNSPVMIDDVVVGSVGKMTVQALACRRRGLGQARCGRARQRGGQRRPDQPAGIHAPGAQSAARPSRRTGRLKPGATIPLNQSSTYPSTEQTLSSLSVRRSTPEDWGRSATSSTTSTPRCPGARRRSAICSSRLDKFVGTLDEQRDNIVASIQALNRLAGTLAGQRDVITAALNKIPPALDVLDQGAAAHHHRAGQTAGRSATPPPGWSTTRRADLVKNLQNLEPTIRALADVGPDLDAVTGYAPTFPYTQNFIDRDIRGDYINGFFTIDLTIPRLKRSMLLGTRLGTDGRRTGAGARGPRYLQYSTRHDPLHRQLPGRWHRRRCPADADRGDRPGTGRTAAATATGAPHRCHRHRGRYWAHRPAEWTRQTPMPPYRSHRRMGPADAHPFRPNPAGRSSRSPRSSAWP